MSTAEQIFKGAKELPDDRQFEALQFINFLLSQQKARAESTEWAAFSGQQMARSYGPEDSVYDQRV